MITLPALSHPNRVVRRCAVATQVVLVLGTLASGWWWYINRIPAVNLSPVALPEPNGYTRLDEASRQLVRDDDVANAIRKPGTSYNGGTVKAFSNEEKAALVQANRIALGKVRGALLLSFQEPPKKNFDEQSPEWRRFRQAARTLVLDGKVKETHGEMHSAADSYLDAVDEGTRMMPGVMITRLVGIACATIGRRPLFKLADQLPAETAHASAQRLETIFDSRPPIAQTFQAEKRYMQSGLADVFRRSNVIQAGTQLGYVTTDENGQERSPLQQTILRTRLLLASKQAVIVENARQMDALSDWASLPRPADVPPPASSSDLFNQSLSTVFPGFIHKDLDDRAQTALLVGKLALRAYFAEKGTYPATLEELVKVGGIRHLPVDPFAREAGQALQYRKTTKGFLLYSVGPDGIDDKGTPIDNRNSDGTYKPWTERGSKGDFVLNVNL